MPVNNIALRILENHIIDHNYTKFKHYADIYYSDSLFTELMILVIQHHCNEYYIDTLIKLKNTKCKEKIKDTDVFFIIQKTIELDEKLFFYIIEHPLFNTNLRKGITNRSIIFYAFKYDKYKIANKLINLNFFLHEDLLYIAYNLKINKHTLILFSNTVFLKYIHHFNTKLYKKISTNLIQYKLKAFNLN